MAYQVAVIPMTLNDLQGHLLTESLLKCDFSLAMRGLCAVAEFLLIFSSFLSFVATGFYFSVLKLACWFRFRFRPRRIPVASYNQFSPEAQIAIN